MLSTQKPLSRRQMETSSRKRPASEVFVDHHHNAKTSPVGSAAPSPKMSCRRGLLRPRELVVDGNTLNQQQQLVRQQNAHRLRLFLQRSKQMQRVLLRENLSEEKRQEVSTVLQHVLHAIVRLTVSLSQINNDAPFVGTVQREGVIHVRQPKACCGALVAFDDRDIQVGQHVAFSVDVQADKQTIKATNVIKRAQDPIKRAQDPVEPSPSRLSPRITQQDLPQLLVKFGADSWTGKKTVNEDRFEVFPKLGIHNGQSSDIVPCSLFSVYDGHGGSEAVDFLVKHLVRTTMDMVNHDSTFQVKAAELTDSQAMDCLLMKIKFAIANAFAKTDAVFLQIARKHKFISGSTALMAFVVGGGMDNAHLLVANVGDCRAVLGRAPSLEKEPTDDDGHDGSAKLEAVAMSSDHKPDRQDEKHRITASGGHVVNMHGVARVTTLAGAQTVRGDCRGRRVLGRRPVSCLAVSRAFGDICLKVPDKLVTVNPEFRSTKLDGRDRFLILACDGVFDVLSNQEAVDIVQRVLCKEEDECKRGSSSLFDKAAKELLRVAGERGSLDNLTAVVVGLPANE